MSPLSIGQTIEQVLDDAINVGAEDVTGITQVKYIHYAIIRNCVVISS